MQRFSTILSGSTESVGDEQRLAREEDLADAVPGRLPDDVELSPLFLLLRLFFGTAWLDDGPPGDTGRVSLTRQGRMSLSLAMPSKDLQECSLRFSLEDMMSPQTLQG